MEQKTIREWIKRVGRGKTLARDLDLEQARLAVGALLDGAFTPAQAGAFLQAMRIKETIADELVGASQALRERQHGVEFPREDRALVVNLAFDTPRKGGVLSLLACALLRRAGICHPVVVWERGILFPDAQAVERTLGYLRQDAYLAGGECPMVEVSAMVPALAGLRGLRAELGFRTILNTLEKVVRPWYDLPVVAGISHGTFSRRLPQVLEATGADRAAAIQGHHGSVDHTLGEGPVEWVVAAAGGLEEGKTGWSFDAPSILLKSEFDRWPELLPDPGSPLNRAIRLQAAFLWSVASGEGFDEVFQKLSR